MVIIDTVINTLLGGLTLDPAGMHCPSRDDTFVSSYRQDCRVAETAGIVFTHRPKIRFFGPLHRFRLNFAVPTGTWVRLAVQNFTSITPGGWECGPQSIKNFHFLVKSRPVRATPLIDYQNA